jgi:hypothetical protein
MENSGRKNGTQAPEPKSPRQGTQIETTDSSTKSKAIFPLKYNKITIDL